MTKFFLILFFILSGYTIALADKCSDEVLLDGADSVMVSAIDTTDHWWAITKPFSGAFCLIIDGELSPKTYVEIQPPVFSPNGVGWAAYVRSPAGWQLLINDSVIPIECTDIGEIAIGQSGEIAYSYFEGNNEIIIHNGRKLRVQQKLSKIYLSPDGSVIGFVLGRIGGQYVYATNGESQQFDEVKFGGIWYDGSTFYAGRLGIQWRIYRGKDAVSGIYQSVSNLIMNPTGTVAAVVCNQSQSAQAFLYSDDYYEPLESKRYDAISQLILHPTLPLMGFRGVVNNVAFMVFNRTEYDAGKETSAPYFTHDGSEFVFCGFDTDFFITINGKKYVQSTAINLNQPFAVKPKGNSFSVATNSGMIVRELEKSYSYAGRMVDFALRPRYSWRHDAYETLGFIRNRVFLLKCKMD